MPVLGMGGRLVLKRKAPDPIVLGSREVLDATSNQLLDISEGYESGDRVTVKGLPIYVKGVPIKPAGWAMYYGSRWYLGPDRWHVASADHRFYRVAAQEFPDGRGGDTGQFYANPGDKFDQHWVVPEDPEPGLYIHVSGLGYCSFYSNRCSALRGCREDRIDLAPVGLPILIGPYGSNSYNNAVAECMPAWGDYQFSDFFDPDTGISICQSAPLYEVPVLDPMPMAGDYEDADITRTSAGKGYLWEVVCGVREWALNLDAPSVDTTGVSEKWGDAVKSLVNGGGTIEFFIDRECYGEGVTNGLPLMELLSVTNKAATARAEFWMMSGSDCSPIECADRIDGSLYYETDILITASSVNLRPTEAVVGVANFITTGEIKLLQEPYRQTGQLACMPEYEYVSESGPRPTPPPPVPPPLPNDKPDPPPPVPPPTTPTPDPDPPGPNPDPDPDPPAPSPGRRALFDRTLPANTPDWVRDNLLDAMTVIEKYVQPYASNTNLIEVNEFRIDDQDSANVIAWCAVSDVVGFEDANAAVLAVQTTGIILNVNSAMQNNYDDNRWTAIWVHELLHGLGISYWRADWYRNYTGKGGTYELSYLGIDEFPNAVAGYRELSGENNSQVVPIYRPESAHWEREDKVLQVEGAAPREFPGVAELMNPTESATARLTNLSLGCLEDYGYVVETVGSGGVVPYSLRLKADLIFPDDYRCIDRNDLLRRPIRRQKVRS